MYSLEVKLGDFRMLLEVVSHNEESIQWPLYDFLVQFIEAVDMLAADPPCIDAAA